MSPEMKRAMRKEAFVQGWIRSKARSLGRALVDVPDAEILSWLPEADEAFAAFERERGR